VRIIIIKRHELRKKAPSAAIFCGRGHEIRSSFSR